MHANVWSHLGVKSWIVIIKASVKIIFILPNEMDWLQHPVSFCFEIKFFHLRAKMFGIHQQNNMAALDNILVPEPLGWKRHVHAKAHA